MRELRFKDYVAGIPLYPGVAYTMSAGDSLVLHGEYEFSVLGDGVVEVEGMRLHGALAARFTVPTSLAVTEGVAAIWIHNTPSPETIQGSGFVPLDPVSDEIDPDYLRFQEWASAMGLVNPKVVESPLPSEEEEDEIYEDEEEFPLDEPSEELENRPSDDDLPEPDTQPSPEPEPVASEPATPTPDPSTPLLDV